MCSNYSKQNFLLCQKMERSSKDITCSVCHKTFKSVFNRKRHELYHGIVSITRKNLQCSKCLNCYSSNENFINHFPDYHPEVVIETSEFFMDSEEQFRTWKSNMEKDTSAFYQKVRTYKLKSCLDVTRYTCHRSGVFKSRSKGQRRLKFIGSLRVGYHCPSCIIVKRTENSSKLKVLFISTHFGHENDANRLKMTKDGEKEIACHLQSNVPIQRICYSKNKHTVGQKIKSGSDIRTFELNLEQMKYRENLEQMKYRENLDQLEYREREVIIHYLRNDKFSKEDARKTVLSLLDRVETCSSQQQFKEIINSVNTLQRKLENL